MSNDITYCTADCKNKAECERDPERIKHSEIPHSYADFSEVCEEFMKGERNERLLRDL